MSRAYPDRPVLAVGAAVFDAQGRVLLVRRGHPPSEGLWSIPGGSVEAGESMAEACTREVLEETGLVVEVGELIEVIERIVRDEQGRVEFHYVVLDHLAKVVSGTLRAGDDCSDARWCSFQEVATLETTDGLFEFVQRAYAMR